MYETLCTTSCFPGQNQSQCFRLPLLPIWIAIFFISQNSTFFIFPVRGDKGHGTIFSDRERESNNAIPAFKKTAQKIASKVIGNSYFMKLRVLLFLESGDKYIVHVAFLDHYQCCQQWSYTFKKHYLLFEQWAYNYKLVPPPYRNFLPAAKAGHILLNLVVFGTFSSQPP